MSLITSDSEINHTSYSSFRLQNEFKWDVQISKLHYKNSYLRTTMRLTNLPLQLIVTVALFTAVEAVFDTVTVLAAERNCLTNLNNANSRDRFDYLRFSPFFPSLIFFVIASMFSYQSINIAIHKHPTFFSCYWNQSMN